MSIVVRDQRKVSSGMLVVSHEHCVEVSSGIFAAPDRLLILWQAKGGTSPLEERSAGSDIRADSDLISGLTGLWGVHGEWLHQNHAFQTVLSTYY